MTWQVRRAFPEDAAALSLIAGASFLETFAGILDGPDIVAHCAANNGSAVFAKWLADPANVVAIAEHDAGRAPIGYTVLTRPDLPIDTGATDIELKRIYTLGRARGTGLGAALMQVAFADARALGHTRILLGVYGKNARAHRFYEKQGFSVAGTRQFLVGKTLHDDRIYARDL